MPTRARVLVYAPTWREDVPVGGTGGGAVDLLDVRALAAELAAASTETGEEWLVVARGHTRTHDAGGYGIGESRVIDASRHPDVNDVILAADLLITDYSSVMFDAAVARVPMAFFVPDLVDYRDRERGFTFDFEASAPGPLLATRAQLVDAVRSGDWRAYPCSERYDAWCARFLPHEDGGASERVVDALIERRVLPAGAAAETEDR
ncbi:CDP-glycerol glycerophosphotransferase family protein [Leucobacter soli]|uniref:CDP-glycerol glycerophosphotransferase family protein n=1 Tax=Leucobacter soli TaxID=2812850 RepID=UPI00360BECE1